MTRIIRHLAVEHDVSDDVWVGSGQTGNASSLGAHFRARWWARDRKPETEYYRVCDVSLRMAYTIIRSTGERVRDHVSFTQIITDLA